MCVCVCVELYAEIHDSYNLHQFDMQTRLWVKPKCATNIKQEIHRMIILIYNYQGRGRVGTSLSQIREFKQQKMENIN